VKGAALWAAGLLALGVCVYVGHLDAPFIYDDASIVEDRDIRQPIPPWQVIRASPDSAAAGRPVVHYTLALNYALGGLDVRGYRAFNLAVHLACALVLFGIVGRTLRRAGPGGDFALAWRGLAATIALVWMLHPLQSECVNYISQRSESLMGLFYLLTLYASIRALDAERSRLWTVAAILCCALGMASKEVMVTAPLMVPLYDLVFAGRSPRRLFRERAGLYLGLAACWIVLAFLMAAGPRAASVGFSLGTGAFDYTKNQCIVVVDYLRLVFWPHPLVLDYGYPRPLSWAEVAPHAALLAGLLAATTAALRWRSRIGFAAVWTFLILAPTSTFVPIVTEVGAERRMYLSLAGPIVLVVVGAYWLLRRLSANGFARRAGWALALTVAILLAWTTVLRNRDYASAISIWQSSVEARPDNHRAHGNLGKALQQDGRLEEAMAHYRRALELQPDYAEGLNNMGSALMTRGDAAGAIESFRRAVASRPGYAEALYNLARALQDVGRHDEAVTRYREALRSRPDHARAHNNLGTVLGLRGDLDAAIVHFREALRLEPDYAGARRNLELAVERARRREGR